MSKLQMFAGMLILVGSLGTAWSYIPDDQWPKARCVFLQIGGGIQSICKSREEWDRLEELREQQR